ncbi:MAG: HEPN domain-containing protein [bacterium]|nr:HEPN domain-containing protein [bacterium]
MTSEFQDCLTRGKLKSFSQGMGLCEKELRIAKEDYVIATKSFEDKNYRWAIIQTYYSMFHSARALLYSKNFREKSHYCLIQAINELFVKEGLLSVIFLDAIIEAKQLREVADYYGDFSDSNAEKLIGHADRFIKRSEEILNNEPK